MKLRYRMASYELCALAVLAFIVDHAGYYFDPENQWLRVFRLFGLVWFFPAGYNSGWRGVERVWWGIVALAIADQAALGSPFPLQALATLLAARFTIDPLMEFSLKSGRRFWAVQLVLALLIIPSERLSVFGTMGFIIATAGWLVRHRDRLPKNIVDVRDYFIFMMALYTAEQYWFPFNIAQLIFVVVTCWGTAALMYNFKALILEDLRRKKQPEDAVRKICRFLAKRSLEIFVLHLLLFDAIYLILMW